MAIWHAKLSDFWNRIINNSCRVYFVGRRFNNSGSDIISIGLLRINPCINNSEWEKNITGTATCQKIICPGPGLRAGGKDGSEAISIRQDEAREGALLMPSHAAALYNLFAPARPSEPGREPEEGGRLFVIYVPGATTEELGLPPAPADGTPWLMYPGEPNAHIMISS